MGGAKRNDPDVGSVLGSPARPYGGCVGMLLRRGEGLGRFCSRSRSRGSRCGGVRGTMGRCGRCAFRGVGDKVLRVRGGVAAVEGGLFSRVRGCSFSSTFSSFGSVTENVRGRVESSLRGFGDSLPRFG